MTEPRVRILSRPGCHLCEDAVAVVAAVCAQTGETYVVQDITDDPELVRRYTDQVPVTFVDGAQHDFWRVDPDRLRAALTPRRPRRFGSEDSPCCHRRDPDRSE